MHTLASSHVRGVPAQLPSRQVSVTVHASPSSQGFVLKPVNRQTPAASQAASLQTLPAGQAVPGGAVRQAAEQQSPSSRLPSSHSSNASRKPLPQISIVFPATEKRSVWIPPPGSPAPSTRKRFVPQGLPVTRWSTCGLPTNPGGGAGEDASQTRKGPTRLPSGPAKPGVPTVFDTSTRPAPSAWRTSTPYGWVNVYVAPATRPSARTRMRPKASWSPGTTTPCTKPPSTARVRRARPPPGSVSRASASQ